MRFVSNCFFLLLCNLLYSEGSVNSVNEEYIEEVDTNIKEHVDSDIDEAFSVSEADSSANIVQSTKFHNSNISDTTNTINSLRKETVSADKEEKKSINVNENKEKTEVIKNETPIKQEVVPPIQINTSEHQDNASKLSKNPDNKSVINAGLIRDNEPFLTSEQTFLKPTHDAMALEENADNVEDVLSDQNETKEAELDSLFNNSSHEEVEQTTVQILDKISGECFNFPVKVGDMLVFKKLRIRVYKCFKTPPTEKLEYKGFIEIWQMQDLEPVLIHYGWMFSNHSVNIMQNPEYDVRIVN